MRHKIIHIIIILATLGLLLIITQPCYANPIDPYSPIKMSPPYTLWLISPAIETVFIVCIFRFRLARWKSLIWPAIAIYFLNLITLPITQYMAHELFTWNQPLYHYNYGLVYLAELFPLIVEFVVLWLMTRALNNSWHISTAITPELTALVVLGANLVTFILGFAFYYYFPTPYNPAPHYLFPPPQ